MELVVDKHLKLDKPFMSDLQPTEPRLIKVTDPVSNNDRADVKALENAKTGKVTTVVAVMHLYCNAKSSSINDNAKIIAKKTKLGSKLKKLDLNLSKKRPNKAQPQPRDTSKRLIATKHKTIRVLLDTGSSGDLLFLEKGSNKYIPVVSRAVPESWSTSNGTFKTEKVGEIELSFVEYSANKKVHLLPDIVEYSKGGPPLLYDLIIG
jgi:hypothetical protein